MDVLTERTCPDCQGTGSYTSPGNCPQCNGSGVVSKHETGRTEAQESPSSVMRRAAASMRSPMPGTFTWQVADWLEETARQFDGPPCDDPRGVCNGCERREDFNDALRAAQTWLDSAAACEDQQ